MTGLDVERDCLVEVAVVVTNDQLELLDAGIEVVIKPREDSLAGMNDFVRKMHTDSGLIEEFENGLELAEAEQVILEYVKRFVPDAKDAPLAGNTIGTDRMFLNRYMPELDQHLHYRNIDVSSIKELSRRWYPRVYFQMPKKGGNHRALADILESIVELKYYRQTVFVPEPGPTSEQAQQAASALSAN
jgi:oligoribonuclease